MGVARFVFQPTLPVRGATPERYPARSRPCNFNPRSPCGERLLPLVGDIVDELISTHAPRAGSDITTTSQSCLKTSFQPTLPVRGATGSDAGPSTASDSFQPTLPVRGATAHVVVDHVDVVISTHAPRAGSDNMFGDAADGGQDFNPRSPCGERRVPERRMTEFALFQPTLPVRGATLPVNSRHEGIFKFQPTLPVRGATRRIDRKRLRIFVFQPTLPVRGATAIYCVDRVLLSICRPKKSDWPRKTSCKDLKETECGANLPRDAWEPHVRTADYSAKKPSASYVGFAPTCSIFVWYLLPR